MSKGLSIIIPILNEAKFIGKLLKHLMINSSSLNQIEILIVDGGSVDKSISIVENFIENSIINYQKIHSNLNFRLIHSEKGRAKQLNTGASHATTNVLYFLHADSFPPTNYDQFIMKEINNGNDAGCFRMQFDSSHWWLRLSGWLTRFQWRACRGGDQSQFITKELFEEIGGYNEDYVVYEDNILINELYKRKKFTVINKRLNTSARRYKERGIWKLQYHFLTIYIKKWLGASPSELHTYYKRNIG